MIEEWLVREHLRRLALAAARRRDLWAAEQARQAEHARTVRTRRKRRRHAPALRRTRHLAA